MMSGGVKDVEIPVCNVDLSTRTSCVHDPVTCWASHAVLLLTPELPRRISKRCMDSGHGHLQAQHGSSVRVP